MICPACGKTMVQQDFGGVIVDACLNGCGSIWFDWMELTKLDENNEGFGAALDAALAAQRSLTDPSRQLKCPRCGMKMHKHLYQKSKAVTVDECYQCGGFFLDAGELIDLRKTHMSRDQIEEYVDRIIRETPEISSFLTELEEKKKLLKNADERKTLYKRLLYSLGRPQMGTK